MVENLKSPLFTGDREGCLRTLSSMTGCYVYTLRRPDGRPFYVGKGTGARVFQHENEARHPNSRKSNSHKLNVIRAVARSGAGIIYEIDSIFESAVEAYWREEELIRLYKRLHEGGPLTNRHPGGGSTAEPSPFSKQKHTATLSGIPEDDPETATLNRFILSIGEMRSVVLKPISRFSPRPTQIFPKSTRKPTPRQAIALAATAAANGILIEEGCELPRSVIVDDVPGFVENGVSCDIATSRMATVISSPYPENEIFRLTASQARTLIGFIGAQKSYDLGIISENALEEGRAQ